MGRLKRKIKVSILKLYKSAFPRLNQNNMVHVKAAFELPDEKICFPKDEYPIEIYLHPDEKPLHIYPEKLLSTGGDVEAEENFLIFDPATYFDGISGFQRLKPGDSIILGGENNEECAYLNIPAEIVRRKLSIFNDEGTLVFKNLQSNPRTCIYPVSADNQSNRILDWRLNKIERLKNIIGNPSELLSVTASLDLIRKVNAILDKEALRTNNKQGRPGGVLEFPEVARVVIVGDLHGKPDNLLVILTQNGILEALEDRKISMLIIGDAVHPEGEVPLDEMESSLATMDLIFLLKVHFPEQVFYLRGNHDSFSSDIAKGGIPQGMLWKKALINTRGKKYLKEMKRLYQRLPYIAFSKHFITCHAAPPTSPANLDDLINIHSNKALIEEIINNRMLTSNRMSGYTKKHVKRFRKCLGVSKSTQLIVGHTVYSSDETLWEDVGGIKNHTVIYSSDSNWVGIMIQLNGRLVPLVYPAERLIPLFSDRQTRVD